MCINNMICIHTHIYIYDSGDGGGLVVQSCPTPVTPWILACYAPLSMGFFQTRILEWIATSFSNI